jgi:hypothetical protein
LNFAYVKSDHYLPLTKYQVQTSFMIRSKFHTGDFHFSKTHGVLPPNGGFQEVVATFAPQTPGQISVEKYDLVIGSESNQNWIEDQYFRSIEVLLSGQGTGPIVQSETNVVDFEDVYFDADKHLSYYHIFRMFNESNFVATFQFQIGAYSCFQLQPSFGEIPPNGCVSIKVAFTPRCEMNYFRAIECWIENSGPLV